MIHTMDFLKILWLLISLLLTFSTNAQQKATSVALEINSGAQIGWWLYDRGSTATGIHNTEGFDNSHLSFFLPLEVNVLTKVKSFRVGVGGTYYAFFDKSMRRQYYDRPIDYKYQLSEGHVDFFGVHLLGEWVLFQNRNWAIVPHLKFGTFWVNSLHPDQAGFGLKTNIEIGLNQEIKVNKTTLVLRPLYRSGTIQPKQKNSKNHKHHIYAFGVMMGARINLTNSTKKKQ